MMQVENEVGLLGAARDYSGSALEAWNSPIPAALLSAVEDDTVGFHEDILNLFAGPAE